jgi:hypothetical protein
MAFSATPAAAQYVHKGARSATGAYSESLMNKSDVVSYINRANAPLNNILRARLSKRVVKTMTPMAGVREETPQEFTPSGNASSTSGSKYDLIPFANANINLLHVGDVLTCVDLFCDRTGANYSSTKATALDLKYAPETMKIVGFEALDSTNRYAWVIRGNGASPATPTQITSSHKLLRLSTAMPEDWEPPTGSSEEPAAFTNYLQVHSITAHETEIHKNGEFYWMQSFDELLAWKEAELLKRIERQYILGQYATSSTNNYYEYQSRGLLTTVPIAAGARDGLSRVRNFGGDYNPEDFRGHLDVIRKYGAPRRLVLTGSSMITTFRNYHEKEIVINDRLKSQWLGDTDMNVWTWSAGSLILDIIAHPVFDDMSDSTNNYSRDMLFIDLNQLGINVYNGMDLQRRELDLRPHSRSVEIFCVCGLDVSPLIESLAYIHNITG